MLYLAKESTSGGRRLFIFANNIKAFLDMAGIHREVELISKKECVNIYKIKDDLANNLFNWIVVEVVKIDCGNTPISGMY